MSVADLAESKQRVRATALWAGLGAVIMLFFGYRGEWEFPDSNPMRTGAMIFVYTLKIGGWVMAVEALWLLTGARAALFCDGAVTMLIGLLLVAGGLLMTPGSIGKAVLFILFGLLFIHSGLRSWRDAKACSHPSPEGQSIDLPTPPVADTPAERDGSGPGGTEQGM